MENLERLQEAVGYHFKDPDLLIHALRHSSYINEHKLSREDCNERLEFLGDAVLELVSSDFLYNKFTDRPEGELSKMRAALVCEASLSEEAARIGLGDCIFLGKGEEASGGRTRPSVSSDAFEALIGAIYLDGGIEEASCFIRRSVLSGCEEKLLQRDTKSALQEIVQKEGKAVIEYVVVNETGPEHEKVFEVRVDINGKESGYGLGHSKKAAEKEAARDAIRKLKGLD